MTNEKMLQIINQAISTKSTANLFLVKEELEQEIRKSCEKSRGKLRPFKAVMNIIKSTCSEHLKGSWISNDIQYVTNGCIGIALNKESHMDLPEMDEQMTPPNLNTIFDNCRKNAIIPLQLPAASEVKCIIKIEKAKGKPKDKIFYDFGDESLPMVNANYLLWVLEALTGSEAFIPEIGSAINPILFKSNDGEALLCPVRRNTK